MNTGLQDAHNLALLLADVRQGRLGLTAPAACAVIDSGAAAGVLRACGQVCYRGT